MIDETLQQYKEKSKELERLGVLENSLQNDLFLTSEKVHTCYKEFKEFRNQTTRASKTIKQTQESAKWKN